MGVQRKLAAHLSDRCAAGMDFVPIVVETLGGLLRMPSLLFGRLGRPSPNVLAPTIPLPVLLSFLTASYLLVAGNAHLWLHQCPTLPPPVDGII